MDILSDLALLQAPCLSELPAAPGPCQAPRPRGSALPITLGPSGTPHPGPLALTSSLSSLDGRRPVWSSCEAWGSVSLMEPLSNLLLGAPQGQRHVQCLR